MEPTEKAKARLLLHQLTQFKASSRLVDVLEDLESSGDDGQEAVRSDMTLMVMGKPALLFATSIYDEELAMMIWLFPKIAKRYQLPKTQRLLFRDLFFVKYEAREGERSELALHRDGSVLSFNMLLNSADDFIGGGTYFDATKRTVHITQGDVAVHSGKVLHAGAPVLTGQRQILVGFLDVADCVF
ncbi:hypothetical protein BBJ29_000099 [Phytophthora kernoviae]|uniref:Fe2OG dioxygenase domain-containing protein n=1 Tax=Phytophthora kernoviae TaxID=325452 RepID=A0A3F2S2W0_9STRA|nr:hypothetical protein BBJ29_000099 [Phytophthora kernoviae]RLN68466.1 hypothetical protein BBP00_00001024 [Phytophthora kernoviae]